MKVCDPEIVKEKRTRVLLTWADLQLAIGRTATRAANINEPDSCLYRVTIEEETEGSPPYKTGYKAVIDITEKLP